MISIDQALDRLLHKRSYLAAFLEDRVEELDLAPDDLEALATVDRAELARAAVRVRSELLHRKHRGSGGLPELYPKTLGAWRAAQPGDEDLTELLSRFMESEAFDAYREVPFAGKGLSLEEAFFRFCEAAGIGGAATREEEMLTAIMKALVMSPRPEFTVPICVRRAPAGFFAVSSRSGPVLYAALEGRLVMGPITPFLAELLTHTDPPKEVAIRHGVGEEALLASLDRLIAMGLLENARIAQADTDADTEADTDADMDADTEADTEADTDTGAETGADTDTGAETGADTDAGAARNSSSNSA